MNRPISGNKRGATGALEPVTSGSATMQRVTAAADGLATTASATCLNGGAAVYGSQQVLSAGIASVETDSKTR